MQKKLQKTSRGIRPSRSVAPAKNTWFNTQFKFPANTNAEFTPRFALGNHRSSISGSSSSCSCSEAAELPSFPLDPADGPPNRTSRALVQKQPSFYFFQKQPPFWVLGASSNSVAGIRYKRSDETPETPNRRYCALTITGAPAAAGVAQEGDARLRR